MEVIRQESKDKTCGQCCVAMITGKPIGEVIERYGHDSTSNIKEARNILMYYGYMTEKSVVVDNRKNYKLPELAFIRMERIGSKVGHFVVHYKGQFYDSCNGVFNSKKDLIEFYKKHRSSRWRIRQYVVVKKPLEDADLIASG